VPLIINGPQGGGTYQSYLNNCTVVFNSGGSPGVSGGATNCIIYYNTNGLSTNWAGAGYRNCCTFPLPGPGFGNIGNITNAPLFVDNNGDFHLQSSSPCINAGNNASVSVTADFDGNPRIQGGTVDIGCYEYQSPMSVISYAWLQQYGLPTDGSVDYSDLDGTAFDVYQDWLAGLNPTNPASVLAVSSPAPTNNFSGIVVSWQSVTNISYSVQRSTNLPSFTTIQSGIAGHTNSTSYTDTSATNNVPYFYRVTTP
jgi:hypothetical protein